MYARYIYIYIYTHEKSQFNSLVHVGFAHASPNHPYLVCILFCMPFLYLFTVLFSCNIYIWLLMSWYFFLFQRQTRRSTKTSPPLEKWFFFYMSCDINQNLWYDHANISFRLEERRLCCEDLPTSLIIYNFMWVYNTYNLVLASTSRLQSPILEIWDETPL